ncbi:DUF6328 family protein [Blastococcus saxobsidens]|uniref:Uncharacterized protein n=1 Tax=Blastococcus saxobsidens (strain DD2) TaxID=1146883 RepID=H6RSD0_BLASD|nr:DUF6328 family protein [Blastococcus saxobsidens]CCG05522.1 conserved membrane protein of unknown function [Blastococcus saxobsidens DD2]
MPSPAEPDPDRELAELTSELRVLLAAATVLFAFLLTVPFSSRFARVEDLDVVAYFVAFLSTAFAIVLFLGETAYHRLTSRSYDKERLVATASRQAVGGIALLGIALPAVVFLVTDVLFPTAAAVAAATALFAAVATTWFLLPLLRRRR